MSIEDFDVAELIEENAKLKLDVAELEDIVLVLENELEEYIEETKGEPEDE